MIDTEYAFLDNNPGDIPFETFYDAGMNCYVEGWIDDFGLLTPKGKKAMENYVDGATARTL